MNAPRVAVPERDALIRRMYEQGATLERIGEVVGITCGGVANAARRLGLPRRRPPPAPRQAAGTVSPPPAARKPPRQEDGPTPRPALAVPDWTAERDARLIATHGRYAELSALADKWDMPIRRVMARYHAVRP